MSTLKTELPLNITNITSTAPARVARGYRRNETSQPENIHEIFPDIEKLLVTAPLKGIIPSELTRQMAELKTVLSEHATCEKEKDQAYRNLFTHYRTQTFNYNEISDKIQKDPKYKNAVLQCNKKKKEQKENERKSFYAFKDNFIRWHNAITVKMLNSPLELPRELRGKLLNMNFTAETEKAINLLNKVSFDDNSAEKA